GGPKREEGSAPRQGPRLARAALSPGESPERSSTTCPRACVCQGARARTAGVGGRTRSCRGAAGRVPVSALPGRGAQGPPTGGGGGERAGRRRRRWGFPGLPLPGPRVPGAGPGRGGGSRGEGARSPRGGPGSALGRWIRSIASGRRGFPEPRSPRREVWAEPSPAPAPARRPPPPPPAAWSAPPSPPRVWRADAGRAAGAAQSASRRRGSCSGRTMRELAIEIGVRALLFGVFVFTEFLDPFQRVIQPEEIWLYKNPLVQSDNIPTRLMFAISFLTPLAVICVVKIIRRTDKTEIKEAFLAVSLALALNGVCTNTIKLIVGR
uniref:Phospholipid phosphatase 4 n=1 Tax=Macaca mulatta TaxID=9544 RepID=A0A5F7ZFQ8_MACMU